MKGFLNILLISILLNFLSTKTEAVILVPGSEIINVTGTTWPAWDPIAFPEDTVDDDLTTFWHGTDDIQIGETDFLAYQFSEPYDIRRIDFWNEAGGNQYDLGELDIQISNDSTDGIDGIWTTIEHIAGDFDPPGGDFTVLFDVGPTLWISLRMNYQGRAAYGITPAFYLSEIDFYAIPEPATLLLLGLGGLALRRKR